MSLPFRARCFSIAIATASYGTAGLAADPVPANPSAAATQASAPTATVVPANPATAPGEKQGTQEIDSVIVRGKRDLLGESDAKMKKLKDSLPDMFSDGKRKESLPQRVVDKTREYLAAHKDPNKLNNDEKAFIERVQSPLDATHDAGKPVIPQPDPNDYVDPLCQTGSCPP